MLFVVRRLLDKRNRVVTQQSVASVYVRKTAIRKKLGMDEKGDIVEYINNTQAT